MITGACGFLGRHLINTLSRQLSDINIKAVDLKCDENFRQQFDNTGNITTLTGKDVTIYDDIKNDFADCDTVIHLAGVVSFCLADQAKLEKVNIQGTGNVLQAASQAGVKNFYHISSVAALGYGDDKHAPINENFKFNWKIARRNKKFYMLTKHLADLEVNKYRDEQMKCCVLYPGLMLGPGDLINSAKLVKAISQRKIPFNMPGGTNVVDVRDVAKGITLAVKNNIGNKDILLSGKNLTFKEINLIIANKLGIKPPGPTLPRFLSPLLCPTLMTIEKLKPGIELTADNLHSAFRYRYFDNARAKKLLNWQPKISFENTVSDIIEWMKKERMLSEDNIKPKKTNT
jgi:dihydroflavonol-4-reductase